MQISRRALMLGMVGTSLAACSNAELGAHIDEGGFGNPTGHNVLLLTGQLPFAIDLAQRFNAEVPTTVTFDFDSARLDGQAQAILRVQARWIRHFPEVMFRVNGNADLVGSSAYNQRLGMRRARAVVAYLVRQGVSRRRLEAVISNGETQPLIDTPERERQNRRAVTEVSGFLQDHPHIINGEYMEIVHRQYVSSAAGSSGRSSGGSL